MGREMVYCLLPHSARRGMLGSPFLRGSGTEECVGPTTQIGPPKIAPQELAEARPSAGVAGAAPGGCLYTLLKGATFGSRDYGKYTTAD
jgi:hypothetical protein